MIKVLVITGLVIYLALLVELIMGWHPSQEKKFYQKLFNWKVYFVALLFSALLLIKPIMDLVEIRQFTLPFLAIPFVYLFFFKIVNWVCLRMNKRNIIITGKGDKWPKDHKMSDSLLHFAATILAIAIPLGLSYYVDIKYYGELQFYYLDVKP